MEFGGDGFPTYSCGVPGLSPDCGGLTEFPPQNGGLCVSTKELIHISITSPLYIACDFSCVVGNFQNTTSPGRKGAKTEVFEPWLFY